jgi:hypothetical protein
MPDESPKLTLFQELGLKAQNNKFIAYVMHLSGGAKTAILLIGGSLAIIAYFQKPSDGRISPDKVPVNSQAAADGPPENTAASKNRGPDSHSPARPASPRPGGPVSPSPGGPVSLGSGGPVALDPRGPVSPGPTAPPGQPIPAGRLAIAPPAPGQPVGPRWIFVARGRSESGYLYPYVVDGSNGARFVGSPLEPIGAGSWRGDAPIGNNETKSGTSYSVSIIRSKEPIRAGRTGALSNAEIISSPVTVTRR